MPPAILYNCLINDKTFCCSRYYAYSAYCSQILRVPFLFFILYFRCFLFPGLDLPIKDLKIDGKTFIAQRLNGKDNYGKQIFVMHIVLSA